MHLNGAWVAPSSIYDPIAPQLAGPHPPFAEESNPAGHDAVK
jgi:hypothetical protein